MTFGGGMTMVYGGLSLAASAVKSPSATHRSYRRCSTSPGAYWAESNEAVGAVGSASPGVR